MGLLKTLITKLVDGRSFAANGMVLAFDDDGGGGRIQRSSQYESDVTPPARVDLRKYCTDVEDQSQSNSCCANAAAGAYEYLCKRVASENGDEVGDVSRLFIYFVGRKNDQVRRGLSHKVKDEGMTLVGAANALEAQGACLESSWPFELDQVNERPPTDAFNEASDYKITEVKMVPVDVHTMKQCLAEGYPIVFGTKLTQAFFNAPGGVVRTPDPTDPQSAEHGCHAMMIVGYSDQNETFIVRNSWGRQWGDDGYCYMPYNYIGDKEFNMGGMWSCRGLSEYDFTPDDEDDDNDLFDTTITPEAVEIETEELDLGEDEEDPDGADDEAMFDPRSIFKKAFDSFDVDGSGTVSKQECKALLGKMGVPWFLAAGVFGRIDKDNSGCLSEEEFISAFGPLLGL